MDYHSDRFTDHSQLIFKKDKLFAVLPANREGDVVYTHQGLTYGGLVLAPQAKLKDVLKAFESLLTTLLADGVKKLQCKQIPHYYCTQPAEEIDYIAFLVGAKTIRVDSASVIDLQQPYVLQSNRLEGVTKAKKLGLRMVEEHDFSAFWDEILLPNLAKRHEAKPTHTISEITLLNEKFPKQIRQFNVCLNAKLVGGATIFETKTTAHVQYISANEDRQALGTLDFLFHHLITETFKRKRYFSFGISNEEGGTKLNSGLSYWKECFGAGTYAHRFYEIETSNHKRLKDVAL